MPKRLQPIFRDRDELAASAELGAVIESALASSRALIVLCSRSAARSLWTNREIATFKRLRPDRPILAAIVDGEPYASEMPGREDEEAFPPALRFRLDAHGEPTPDRAEPIAADFRSAADGKRLGKLKLIAGMLGVGLDDLVRRDAARRARIYGSLAIASIGGMAVTSGLTVFAFSQRSEAVRQREQADGLVEFMLTDLRAKLEPVGRLDVLDVVGAKALQYYGMQNVAALDADALGRRSRALLLVGEVADLRGNEPRALDSFRKAAQTTGELLQRSPHDWQRIFDHAQSTYWLGYMAGETGNADQQLRAFEQYRSLGERLVALRPTDRRSRMEAAYGGINLGGAYRDLGRYPDALAAYRQAANQLQLISPRDRDVLMPLAEVYAHSASILHDTGQDTAAIAERQLQIQIFSRPPFTAADKDVQQRLAVASHMLGTAYLAAGDLGRGERSLDDAARNWQSLRNLDPTNQDLVDGAAITDAQRAQVQLALGNRAKAASLATAAVTALTALHQAKPDSNDISLHLLAALTTALASGDSDAGQLRGLVERFAGNAKLADLPENRATIAAALVALGDGEKTRDPAQAHSDWTRAAAELRSGDPLSTWGECLRLVVARKLGKPMPKVEASVNLAVAYGGYYANR